MEHWRNTCDLILRTAERLTLDVDSDELEYMADTLASPLAFELCGSDCKDPHRDNDQPDNHVSCPSSDTCSKGDCYCQLFQRPKNSADKPWRVAPRGYDKLVKYRDDVDYKCLCVKPILEGEQTIEDTKYAARYVLCGLGGCFLEKKDTYVDAERKYRCAGKCESECKCTLFRLQIGKLGGAQFKPESAKWEYVAKADKWVPFSDGYLYRCFCLK
jgi:hypothetical protein